MNTNNTDQTNEDLLTRIKQGDEDALTELDANVHHILIGVAEKVVGNPTDAVEVYQETLIQVWNQAKNYSPEKGHAISWMATIAKRRAIDHVRRACSYTNATTKLVEQPEEDRNEPNAADITQQREIQNILSEKLQKLPDEQALVLRLAFLEFRSQKEIANKTHTPLGTIKTRIVLGLKKMRQAIDVEEFKAYI